ncbi:MAG: precorrin-6A/cobalt-precorrin-6A reductase, partial [Lachnospiraceae bacterium]
MEKKSKILIFAGTTEGRELAEFLSGREFPVEVSVATEYGETLLSPGPFLKIHQGRMEEAEMEAFFREEEIRTVVDATHPYAVVVSENIRQACEHTETEYIRLLREESSDTADCIFVEDTAGAVEYLKQTEGNVLLTTGSKELKAFTALPDFEKRLYARVLSTPEVAAMAASLGFVGKHLICMQGPFSRELNTA